MKDNRMKLRILMAKFGLKAKDVAVLIHRNQGTVRAYMCGVNALSDELLIALEERIAERESTAA